MENIRAHVRSILAQSDAKSYDRDTLYEKLSEDCLFTHKQMNGFVVRGMKENFRETMKKKVGF